MYMTFYPYIVIICILGGISLGLFLLDEFSSSFHSNHVLHLVLIITIGIIIPILIDIVTIWFVNHFNAHLLVFKLFGTLLFIYITEIIYEMWILDDFMINDIQSKSIQIAHKVLIITTITINNILIISILNINWIFGLRTELLKMFIIGLTIISLIKSIYYLYLLYRHE